MDQFTNMMQYIWHPMARAFLTSTASIRVIVTGNQAGKTATAMMDLSMRMLGIHPVPERNYLPHTVRCVSKSLPKSNEDEENAQYVEFKRFFPSNMIKRDVNGRDKFVMIETGSGDTNKVEFFSKNMDLDAFMSVQRSAYYQDEEIDKVKWDESLVRLLRDGGDIVLTLTPVKGLDWVYDEIWMKAKTIYRSDTICKACNLPAVEHRNGGRDIEVFCWATDDNPILRTDDVDRIMEAIGVSEDDDDDQKMMRRYGVFRQISGRIYKNFLTEIHRISFDKYFNEDAFRYFWHYRMIDYHPTKPWYVSFVAVSPTHEWYVWHELKLMHDRATTIDLRDTIKHSSLVDEEDMYNRRTLVDPLANIAQPNSGFTIMEDLARGPEGLRGVESAFTKTEQARQNIRRRINNSLTCGRPGNNLRKMGEPDPRFGNYLPTLWVMDTCPGHIEHFMKWRMVDPVHEHVKATNDEKRIAQKYSDFCRNIEFLGAEDPVWFELRQQYYNDERDWFNGQRKLA